MSKPKAHRAWVSPPISMAQSPTGRVPSAPEAGRVGLAREIPVTLLALGIDPAPLIAAAGIDPALLKDADNLLPASWLGRLLDACKVACGCPCLALLVGTRGGLSSFGMVGLLMQHSPSVADALHCLVRHGHLYHPEIVPTLQVTDGAAVLRCRILPADTAGSEEAAECALAAAFRMMQALCGPDWCPSEVLLARGVEGRAADFRRVFEAPVRAHEEAGALVFPACWLDYPVVGADLGFRSLLEHRVADLEDMSDEPLAAQVRRSLRPLLLGEGCSAARAADLFAMHSRTMSRRLKAEGLSFQRLVDEVRYEIACHLLRNTSIHLAQAAVALGYSEASAFTRAFHRWSGTTPKAWRLQAASGLLREVDTRDAAGWTSLPPIRHRLAPGDLPNPNGPGCGISRRQTGARTASARGD